MPCPPASWCAFLLHINMCTEGCTDVIIHSASDITVIGLIKQHIIHLNGLTRGVSLISSLLAWLRPSLTSPAASWSLQKPQGRARRSGSWLPAPRQSRRAYGQARAPNGSARAASDLSGRVSRLCWTLIRIALAPRSLLQVGGATCAGRQTAHVQTVKRTSFFFFTYGANCV